MSVNPLWNDWNLTTPATHHEVYLGTVLGGSSVTKIDIQGFVTTAIAAITLTAGQYGLYNVVAGVQFGNTGYSVQAITNGTGAGAAWITYCEPLPTAPGTFILPGSSPLNIVEFPGVPINLKWRGAFYLPNTTDLYFCVGCNTAYGGPPLFDTAGKSYVESGIYP